MTHEELMARGGQVREGAASIERMDPRLKTGRPTFLFNIYACEFLQNTGSTGIYYIPPCPEGQEYVRAPQHVDGTVEDTYPHFTDKEVYRCRPTPGEDIVKAILGIASGQTKGDNIQRFGVFASPNETPTKAELTAAKRALVKELQDQVREADQLFASADPKMRESAQNDKFYRAARYLNVKKNWLSEAAELALCPFCSIAVRPEASICPGCNQVINQAAFDATKKRIGASA